MKKLPLVAAVTVAVLAGPGIAAAAARSAAGGRAVVLVSGLDSSSPFSGPARACAGREGPTWGVAGGIAAAVKRAGFRVFTVPIRAGAGARPPVPCMTPVSGRSTWIDSQGDIDANGAALNRFLAFLHDKYGVGQVTLVGHSDGGVWSRAAIATHHSKPDIDGLVTLGSPFTGSYVADIGTELSGLTCPSTAATCKLLQSAAALLVKSLGPVAVPELTSSFLAGWNAQHTTGSCRVTAIQGTAIRATPRPGLSRYYAPADGLVGQASAADRRSSTLDGISIPAAPIPRLANGGAFPAYHTGSLGQPTELDDAAIDAAVVRILRRPASPCAGARTTGALSTQLLPLRTATESPPLGGKLPASSVGDLVLGSGSITCAGRAIPPTPLLPVPIVKSFIPGTCAQLSAAGPALLLHVTGSRVKLLLSGTSLTVTITGPRVRALTVALVVRGHPRKLRLVHGHATVPRSSRVALQLTGRTLSGQAVGVSTLMAS